MLKGVGEDLVGTADNCVFVPRHAISAEPTHSFLLPGEIPYAFLKSGVQEFIFTDQAYIECYGGSAAGTKRIIIRLEYSQHQFSEVMFETSGIGLTDQDCELKYSVDSSERSIDFKKTQVDNVITLYRALTELSRVQFEAERKFKLMNQERKRQSEIHIYTPGETTGGGSSTVSAILAAESSDSAMWVGKLMSNFFPLSYAFVFEKYSFP